MKELRDALAPLRAVVFNSVVDRATRIDDPELEISADDVLVLRNIGPQGAPGMPEAGYLPIPRKLGRQGVKDMVRISDARMSWHGFRHHRTAYYPGIGHWRAAGVGADR